MRSVSSLMGAFVTGAARGVPFFGVAEGAAHFGTGAAA